MATKKKAKPKIRHAVSAPLSPPETDTTAVLAERGERYGRFVTHASITQSLKEIMRATPKWRSLHADQAEALDMVAHKIGRILNGDPNYADSWVDIEGYAKLVRVRLETGEIV